MHIFRIFAVSVLIPLISVGLCATGDLDNNKPRHKTVLVSEVKPRRLDNATSHEKIASSESSQRKGDDSLPYHPHPLKLDIRSIIKNSTRVDNFIEEGRGGGFHEYENELDTIAWIWSFMWKAVTSYMIVAGLNMIISPLLKRFGYGGPYWETSISLGNDGKDPLHSIGPDIKKLRVSFGGIKGSGKDEKDDKHEKPGWGWSGGDAGAHHHPSGGWLGWDQLGAIPYVDKYSLKAAKKAMHFQKKAHKYAQRAHKYAAKAKLAQLSVKKPYPSSFLEGGYGWPPAHGK